MPFRVSFRGLQRDCLEARVSLHPLGSVGSRGERGDGWSPSLPPGHPSHEDCTDCECVRELAHLKPRVGACDPQRTSKEAGIDCVQRHAKEACGLKAQERNTGHVDSKGKCPIAEHREQSEIAHERDAQENGIGEGRPRRDGNLEEPGIRATEDGVAVQRRTDSTER